MGSDELEKIYKLYYKELYIYAFSICKNHNLTEEFVSDTFFKAFLSIDNCEEHIKYWLMRVCKNLIFDYYKKNKKRTFKSIEDEILAYEDKTLEEIIKDDEKRKLYDVILTLRDSYKEVIIMFYFMKMPIDEIAKYLNTSNGAVRNLLYRGRRKIGELLRGQENEI